MTDKDIIKRQKAEIRRLRAKVIVTLLKKAKRADEARAEGIKEFAEKPKKDHRAWSLTSARGGTSATSLTVYESDIDNLVKEMTRE